MFLSRKSALVVLCSDELRAAIAVVKPLEDVSAVGKLGSGNDKCL